MEHPSISREEDAMSDSAMTDPAPETDTARTQGTSFSDHLSCGKHPSDVTMLSVRRSLVYRRMP